MSYLKSEIDIIIADSIRLLFHKHKKLFLKTIDKSDAEAKNYEKELIKSVGDGVYNKVTALFRDDKYRERVLADLKRRNIECSTYISADYPEPLKHTPEPPLVLYLRGRRELLSTRMFAVVGSRRTPANVLEETKRFCAELSKSVTIVTGVADGGDSAAICGALSTGNIICVLPGGHDTGCYPNVNLYKKAESEGLTVSENPPKTPVQRLTFTLRNRIIAGMSEGVLVVSAGEKSGALSTAGYANDYGRDVFAFPYGVGVSCGAGCNRLIKDGAGLCDSLEDLLFALKIQTETKAATGEYQPDDGEEAEIYKLLKEQGEMHAEKIAALLKMKLTDVVTACSMLEIKGLIVRTGGNSFSII